MPGKEITVATLQNLAGNTTFAEGVEQFKLQRVRSIEVRGQKITANVSDKNHDALYWQVSLLHTDSVFEGSCECPVSDHFEFCSHCVAASMAYLDHLALQEQLQFGTAEERLNKYLGSLSREELQKEFLQLVKEDKVLHDEWMLRTEIASGNLQSHRLKDRIRKAIRTGKPPRGSAEARSDQHRLVALTEKLSELLPILPAEEALELSDYALQRLNAQPRGDDSLSSESLSTVHVLLRLHRDSFARLHWAPEQKVEYLLELFTGEHYAIYHGLPDRYLSSGDASAEITQRNENKKLFLDKLARHWEGLDALDAEADWKATQYYEHLQQPLLEHAAEEDDFDYELAIRAKTASAAADFIRLSQLSLKYNRLKEAVVWFNRAAKFKQSDGGKALLTLKVTIMRQHGKVSEAAKLLWEQYEQMPRSDLYKQLRNFVDETSYDLDVYAKAVNILQDKISDGQQYYRNHYIGLLAEVYLFEGDFARAQELVRAYGLDNQFLRDLISD